MQLRKELDRMKKDILGLSAVVEESLRKAVKAVAERDEVLAQDVINEDRRVDEMEVELEEECLKVLALHQPVAVDLRYIICVLKINNDLERIADLSVNIAKRALQLAGRPKTDMPPRLRDMVEKARSMLRMSLDAFVQADGRLARQVLELDDEVDDMHRSMFADLEDIIRERPSEASPFIQFLTVSRSLERVGDLATNIAEDVIYLVEGRIVRHGGGEIQ